MKVLVTSGGTRINLDSVRHIGNMSNGTLGSRLAKDFLLSGDEVIFFRAEKSKSPMKAEIDFASESIEENIKCFENAKNRWEAFSYRYKEHTYKTFEDYQNGLEHLISLYKPDVVILAAAVSDYAPETVVEGKIRTKETLNIALKPLPKVISNVRKWAGENAFVVGFKLLVDVSKKELLEAAEKSFVENRLDLVCANDLRSILNGHHEISIINGRTLPLLISHQKLKDEITKEFLFKKGKN